MIRTLFWRVLYNVRARVWTLIRHIILEGKLHNKDRILGSNNMMETLFGEENKDLINRHDMDHRAELHDKDQVCGVNYKIREASYMIGALF